MRLVPRQLQIHGLTGDVPYFGGRLTPAQAYAASHPAPVTTGAPPGSGAPDGLVARGGPGAVAPPGTYPPAPSPDRSQGAIQQLLLAGVITTAEADQLSGRLPL